MNIATTYTVTINVMGIDVIALKKLSLVSHALADKVGGRAGDPAARRGMLHLMSRREKRQLHPA